MFSVKPKDQLRNFSLQRRLRNSLPRGVAEGGLFRALVLMVWLLGVPGLRPVYHHHRDEGLIGGSATEQVRLLEHLRQYVHQNSSDTAKLHFHWALQPHGHGFSEFPNAPPMFDISQAIWCLETCGLIASEKLCLDFALQPSVVWFALPWPEVGSEVGDRIARFEDSRGSEQSRRFSYCSTLYRTARL